MARGGHLGLWIALVAAGVAPPPVAAPKPAAEPLTAAVPGCEACRYLASPKPAGRIVPVQNGPTLKTGSTTPAPLPLPREATPLPDAATADAALDALLDRYLPDADPEERSVWADELRHLPPELARDILAARGQVGPLAPRDPAPFTADPAEPEPAADDTAVPPQGEPASSPSLLRGVRRDDLPSPVDDATAAALRQAETILLHNIANADTVAFKRSRPVFVEASGFGGLSAVTPQRVNVQGEIEPTGRPFDLAIDGAGFFQLRRGDVAALTRRGTFTLDASGEIVADLAGEDWSLQPAVRVPAEAVQVLIDQTGGVACRLAGDDEPTPVGQIELARVSDPGRLEPVGGGLLAVPAAAGPVATGLPTGPGLGALRQAALERSNVDLSAELKALARLREQRTALQDVSASRVAVPSPAEHR